MVENLKSASVAGADASRAAPNFEQRVIDFVNREYHNAVYDLSTAKSRIADLEHKVEVLYKKREVVVIGALAFFVGNALGAIFGI